MSTSADKIHRNKGQSLTAPALHEQGKEASPVLAVDNRPEAIAQRKRQAAANSSPQSMQLKALQETANMRPQTKSSEDFQQQNENTSGLPNRLKAGIEHLSGISMDDVTVHYNSDQPAKLQAHAYAKGTDIYLGPGQEKHLPHEAWHVVQQKQKKVQPTMQMKAAGPSNQVKVNDDAALEKDADVMGAKAMEVANAAEGLENAPLKSAPIQNPVAQRLALQYGTARPIPQDAKDIAEAQDKERGSKIEPQLIPGEIPAKVFKAMADKEKVYIVGHGVAALGISPALLEDGDGGKMMGSDLAAVIDALKTGLEARGKMMGPVKIEACMSSLSRKTKKGDKNIKPSLLTDIQTSLANDHEVEDVKLEGNPGLSTGNEFEAGGVKNTSPANTEVSLLVKVLESLYRVTQDDWDNVANTALKTDGLRIIHKQKAVLKAFDRWRNATNSTAADLRAYLTSDEKADRAPSDLISLVYSLSNYVRRDTL